MPQDAVLAAAFCAVSVGQVLLDPIAGPVASVVVALGSTLPLAWRGRLPATAALAGSVVWLVPTEGFLYLGFVIATLLYFSVGTGVSSWPRFVSVTAAGVALGVTAVLLSSQHPSVAAGATLAVVGPAAAGRLVAHQRAQNARLRELTDSLVAERALAERTAVAEERSRIARELHDAVGHEVTVIALQADAAAAALAKAPDRATAPVAAIREAAARALTEMRSVVGLLRAEDDEGLRPQPGLAELPALVDRSRSAGTDVALHLRPPARPAPGSVQLATYRLVQEALTNARRHAPGSSVEVTVDGEDDGLQVRVVDSGGTHREPGEPGFGLVGMRERVRMLGGELVTGHRPGGGFALTARLPLDAPESS